MTPRDKTIFDLIDLEAFEREFQGYGVVFRHKDRTRLKIYPVDKIPPDPSEYEEWTEMYPFLIEYDDQPKVIIPGELRQFLTKIIPLVYDIDIDLDPNLKKNIKDYLQDNPQDSDFQEGLKTYKLLKAKEIREAFPDVEIMAFSDTTTFFHLLIPTPYLSYKIPLTPETFPVFIQEHRGWVSHIRKYFPDYHPEEIRETFLHTKTFRIKILDLEESINFKALQYFYEKVSIQTTGIKDTEKFHELLPIWREMFQYGTFPDAVVQVFGGRHNSFILLLAGELAKSGWTEDEAIKIYKENFEPIDNPADVRTRIANIRQTYEKYRQNKSILGLGDIISRWKLRRPPQRKDRGERLEIFEILTEHGENDYYYVSEDTTYRAKFKKETQENKERWITYGDRPVIKYAFKPIQIIDGYITFKLYNSTEHYTIDKAPIPNTKENKREFQARISHIPLSESEIKALEKIINQVVKVPEVWGISQENSYNEKTAISDTDLGMVDAVNLWRSNPAYRLIIGFALAKYQNPQLPNIAIWLYGMTGAGKSRTLRFIGKAFGVKSIGNATYNYLETYATHNKYKPILIDDATYFRDNPQTLVDVIFSTHSGVGKGRRTSNPLSPHIAKGEISSILTIASENDPYSFFGTVKNMPFGLYRRILPIRLTPVSFPRGLDDNWERRKGWGIYLGKISPIGDPTDDNLELEYEIREYVPYLKGIYKVMNELAGTKYDPLKEIREIIARKQKITTQTIEDELYAMTIREITGYPRRSKFLLIIDERKYYPTAFMKHIAKEVGSDLDTISEITARIWTLKIIRIAGSPIEVYDITDWLNDYPYRRQNNSVEAEPEPIPEDNGEDDENSGDNEDVIYRIDPPIKPENYNPKPKPTQATNQTPNRYDPVELKTQIPNDNEPNTIQPELKTTAQPERLFKTQKRTTSKSRENIKLIAPLGVGVIYELWKMTDKRLDDYHYRLWNAYYELIREICEKFKDPSQKVELVELWKMIPPDAQDILEPLLITTENGNAWVDIRPWHYWVETVERELRLARETKDRG